MKLLCIDTATEACSAALLINERRDAIFEVCPQQQSSRILPMIDELLTRNNIKLAELDAIAYGRGPGSFTGVRIASSTVQGLALGTDLPVVEVSTLAAMAQQNYEQNSETKSLALIDARMSEMYCAAYEVDVDGIVQAVTQEAVLAPSDVAPILAGYNEQSSYVGTGFHAYASELDLALKSAALAVNYPNAQYMLSIAKKQYEIGHTVSVEQIKPVYLRDKVTWKKLAGRE